MTTNLLRHGRAPRSLGPWPGMGAIVAATVAGMTPFFSVAALGGPIAHDLGITAFGFGMVLTAFFAVSAGGATLARRVAVRRPVPALLIAIDGLSIAGLLIAAAASSAEWLALALVVAGVGNALVQPTAGRYIAAAIPPSRLSLASGLTSAALGASPLLPGLMAGIVAGPLGWRVALTLTALLGALALAGAPLARVGDADTTAPIRPDRHHRSAQHATGRVMLLWTAAAALATVGSNMAASYFVQIGTYSGLSLSLAGMMLAAASAVAITVRLVVGLLADRAPRRNPLMVAVMMGIGALGLTLIALSTPTTFVAGGVLTVAGGWGWTGLLLAAMIRLLPGEGARAGAAVQIGLFGGAAAGPLAFGAASTALGIPVAVLVTALTSAVAAALVLTGDRILTMLNGRVEAEGQLGVQPGSGAGRGRSSTRRS